jgi:hypothetical protein
MKKAALWIMLAAMLFALCSCTRLDELYRSDALPDLRLLVQPAYEEPAPAKEESEAAASVIRLDMWLDGSQTMGGVNPNEKSMYPHSSRKYREGGFHYRYQQETGFSRANLHRIIFVPKKNEVTLKLTDRKSKEAAGTQLMVNFVQVKPYFAKEMMP